jgi:hypothetical protein
MKLKELRHQVMNSFNNSRLGTADVISKVLDLFNKHGETELIRGSVTSNKCLVAFGYINNEHINQFALKYGDYIFVYDDNDGIDKICSEFRVNEIEYDETHFFLLDRILNTRYNRLKHVTSDVTSTWINQKG